MKKIKKRRKSPGFSCSFCGKRNEDVGCLVVGPKVHICDECVTTSIVACFERGVDVVSSAMEHIAENAKGEEE